MTGASLRALEGRGGKRLTDKILIVDPDRCTGCRICENACSFFHYGEFNPRRGYVQVLKREPEGVFIPVMCLHCGRPLCVEACPTGALYVHDGAVLLNKDVCIECKQCLNACPFGGIQVDPVTSQVVKCDLCGGDPQCARRCPTGAIQWVRADVANLEKKRIGAERMARLASLIVQAG